MEDVKLKKKYITLHDTGSSPRTKECVFPERFPVLVTGPSNCRKTQLVYSIIGGTNGVNFNHMYVYTDSLSQRIYRLLRECKFHGFSSTDKIIALEYTEPFSIIICDDTTSGTTCL